MAAPPPTESVDSAASQTTSSANKPIHSLIIDTGPLIKNDPSVSALLSQAEALYTIPSVIPEIRDPATRARVETTLLPFLTIRAPGHASVKFVTDFAKRTGDYSVLSRTDIEIIALGYELECERNNGDWRLRNTPGQRSLNGRAAGSSSEGNKGAQEEVLTTANEETESQESLEQITNSSVEVEPLCETPALENTMGALSLKADAEATPSTAPPAEKESVLPGTGQVENPIATAASSDPAINDESDSDSDGWITPSNLKKHQAQDSHSNTARQPLQKTLQAAILTSDYAMQNVALRINLNLVTPSFARITHLKNWVLRCHGCFSITKDMEKQFCPKCGQPTLTRTSCSTDSHGNFQIHLKKNFQWNKRGNVYSVPKAVHGSANGRLPKGQGGKGGWGAELILAEDQKEYTKMTDEQRRQQKKDLMDDDYLPGILSGKRSGHGGKIRVGAGKNVNSKRKH
ncbi:hypothetical protein E4U42_004908 [Claviceps africana]|uniref:20S-pre-rRNA D-site endonuclease NOB1 n=1 Tax=Claviceps africana TaxID=83212 RepID=A0A8K0J558_9HYPO|nr:hypothetical protein E4U42_004908 [Claviceps africana]